MAHGTCSVATCDRPACKRGWCDTHYKRWRMTGDVQADKPFEQRLKHPIACSIADCESLQVARGWCMHHYNCWHDHGDPLYVYVKPQAPSGCSVANCDKPHCTRGMCAAHYQQWRRYGDPLHRTRMKQPERCEAADCDRRAVSLGFCDMHYQRLKKQGRAAAVKPKPSPAELAEAAMQHFWAKVDKTPDCWLWLGSVSPTTGYGTWALHGRKTSAHRGAYELLVGPVPEGLELDHLCRTRACVRPDHLEPVTHTENMARAVFEPKTHCPHEHPLEGHNLIVVVRQGGTVRLCRECKNAYDRRRYWARRKPA